MDVLGAIFLILIGLVVLVLLYLLIRSAPDIRRYRRIRGM